MILSLRIHFLGARGGIELNIFEDVKLVYSHFLPSTVSHPEPVLHTGPLTQLEHKMNWPKATGFSFFISALVSVGYEISLGGERTG